MKKDSEAGLPNLAADVRISLPDANSMPGQDPAFSGGNLSPGFLLSAYEQGYFPWFGEDSPILWWSLDPRFVLFPAKLHLGNRLRRYLRKSDFRITSDVCFVEVVRTCGRVHGDTWIDDRMIFAYEQLHKLGYAHSVEVWREDKLVGGLYGVRIGSIFAGESMFSLFSNASKAAFAVLTKLAAPLGIELVDSQMQTDHTTALGGEFMPRRQYLRTLLLGLSKFDSTFWDTQMFARFNLQDELAARD